MLYTTVVAFKSRKDAQKEADKVLQHILDLFDPKDHPYLQIGGNETVGMGWCKVKVIEGDK